MGMAPVAHVLFNKFMNFNPKNPNWANRDRFVLSYVPSLHFPGLELGCNPRFSTTGPVAVIFGIPS
jgi:hypothetical protein